MDFNAANVGFTTAAYAVSAITILSLCGVIFWRDRQMTKQIKKLDRQKDN